MITNKYVDEYVQLWRDNKIILNKERVDLIKYLQTDILTRDDVYFDEETIENCINFIENGISQRNRSNVL